MLKKKIKYTDYNGVERTEDFYFNLSEAELAKMELHQEGGFENYINRMITTTDTVGLTKLLEDIVLMAYGEKSPDGKRFIKKNGELAKEFMETEAYSKLYIELFSDTNKMLEFINGIVPQTVRDKANSPEVQEKVTEFKKEYAGDQDTTE